MVNGLALLHGMFLLLLKLTTSISLNITRKMRGTRDTYFRFSRRLELGSRHKEEVV